MGSNDTRIIINDGNSASSEISLQGHKGRIIDLVLDSQAKLIYSTSSDRTIRAWSTDSHKQVGQLDLPSYSLYPTCMGISNSGESLACGFTSGEVLFFNKNFGDVRIGKVLNCRVNSVSYADKVEKLIVAGCKYLGKAEVAGVNQEDAPRTVGCVKDIGDFVIHAGTTPFGSLLVLSTYNGLVLWDIIKSKKVTIIEDDDLVTSMSVSSAGVIALGYGDGRVAVWGLKKLKSMFKTKPFEKTVSCIAVCDHTPYIAAGTIEGQIGVMQIIKLEQAPSI